MGSHDSTHGPYGHNFSSPEIMGSQDSVTGPYCLWRHTLLPRDHGLSILRQWCVLFIAIHTLPLRSWAVKGPYCLCPHTIFLCDHGQLRLVTGPFGHSFSFPEIMGCQYSVTGAYC
ncbi:hypothetical protein Bpfe_002343 [Biomphalaria pfeifferi]|nr:hypothetical protein Bpfe_002343 [Biomphalaria pfeifferi]